MRLILTWFYRRYYNPTNFYKLIDKTHEIVVLTKQCNVKQVTNFIFIVMTTYKYKRRVSKNFVTLR